MPYKAAFATLPRRWRHRSLTARGDLGRPDTAANIGVMLMQLRNSSTEEVSTRRCLGGQFGVHLIFHRLHSAELEGIYYADGRDSAERIRRLVSMDTRALHVRTLNYVRLMYNQWYTMATCDVLNTF